MNKAILDTNTQEFIKINLNSNIASLLLKGTPFSAVDTKAIVEQIEAKKKCKDKLPTWFESNNIYYPNKLNIEQTSSEMTAQYKSNLIRGHSLIDLTGGFGVDCFYFAKRFKSVTHCELNDHLSTIVAHNYKQLAAAHIKTLAIDGIRYLEDTKTSFDWIYLDPSRRHDTKGKVFFLKDCLPNVPEHLNLLFSCSKNIMVKTSPLLDLSVGINELGHVKMVHIVAVNNEAKELLWILERDYLGEVEIKTVNIKGKTFERFNFILEDEKLTVATYSEPLTYLYEPNTAILKSGGFNTLSQQLSIFKLHKHSHLYTNNTCIDFPGRAFKIEAVLPYGKSGLKRLNLSRANVTTRNFPETVQHIRKKFGLKDGGDSYLFFTTSKDSKRIIIVTKKV